VNVFDDVAAHFLCVFTHRCGRGLHAERVVEPCLLPFEGPPSLVELVEAGTLSFVIVPGLWALLTGGSIKRSGLTFRGALVRVVDCTVDGEIPST
jgi:hypothetical protein